MVVVNRGGAKPPQPSRRVPTKDRVKIRIVQKTNLGEEWMTVDVLFQVGTLAVIQSTPPHQNTYSVMHVPTGLSVCRQGTREAAITLAGQLWKNHCLAFREKDVTEIRMRLPNWVESWLKECQRTLTRVDPLPHQEKGRQVSSTRSNP